MINELLLMKKESLDTELGKILKDKDTTIERIKDSIVSFKQIDNELKKRYLASNEETNDEVLIENK